ncbi:hypothetical protein AB1Y20_017015 [Prymnesium parvum]|uniref:Solute carrier family 66 member 3 n=1 Tax=Prymnesium parvum TaxID=97485 RepID=A0AB34IA66_PRYPA
MAALLLLTALAAAAPPLSRAPTPLPPPDRLRREPAPLLAARPAPRALASALGWIVSLGSAAVYSPIAFRLLTTHEAEGLAIQTWLLSTVGFGAALVYPLRHRYPLSSYAEYVCLATQSALLLLCVAVYGGHATPLAACAGLSALLGIGAVGAALVPLRFTKIIQESRGAGSTLLIGSILPQITKNFRRRSGGGWSPISSALSASGAAIRVFTTIQLTGDRLLLVSFLIGAILNSILTAQILIFGNA